MKFILYTEGTAEELNIEEIAQYLAKMLGEAKVEIRGDPFAFNLPQEKVSDYAKKIAAIKVLAIYRKLSLGQELLYGEVEFEKRRILGKTRSFGIIYDGLALLKIFSELVPREERSLEFVHIFFTNRSFATWDDGDKRYHLRTSVYGFPSLISTTGLVEAPAKPREFYLLKQQYERMGKDLTELKNLTELKDRFRGRFIDYEDKRLTEVAKGYAMQAVFYTLIGDPFCEDKGCRLYNAHWQEELIFAQLESGHLCMHHTKLLKEFQSSLRS